MRYRRLARSVRERARGSWMKGTNGSNHQGARVLMGGCDTGLAEYTPHGAVVQVQLARECAHGPAFRVMQPQDLGLELTRDHRHTPLGAAADLSAPRP